MTKISETNAVKKCGIRRLCSLKIAKFSCKTWWKEYSIATEKHGHHEKARLITKYTFSDLAMIYISYDGDTFIIRLLKGNLTT